RRSNSGGGATARHFDIGPLFLGGGGGGRETWGRKGPGRCSMSCTGYQGVRGAGNNPGPPAPPDSARAFWCGRAVVRAGAALFAASLLVRATRTTTLSPSP